MESDVRRPTPQVRVHRLSARRGRDLEAVSGAGQQMEVAARRISFLAAWRRGGAIAAVSSGGGLASGVLARVGPLTGLGIGACIMPPAEIALRAFVRGCALCPDLADIRAVARYRARLCSARSRRALAASLRHTASASH